MNSYIFQSFACKSCDDKPFERFDRRILRTATQDICCMCGSVVQEFPAMRQGVTPKDVVSIPAAVSTLLEQLLKQRHFSIGKGINPRPAETPNRLDVERHAKQLAHRAGSQMFIELDGRGNTWATLRWNYSFKPLIPPFPWEEIEFRSENGRSDYYPKSHLKPELSKLEYPRPAHIIRVCDLLSGMQYTGAFVDKRWPQKKSIRFEQRIELDEQPLETTTDLGLVLKVELGWLHVGSSFPDDSGPRVYTLSQRDTRQLMTAEEAVDAAIYEAIHARYNDAAPIYDIRHGHSSVASASNPLRYAGSSDPYKRQFQHRFWLTIRGFAPHYRGPILDNNGEYIVPAGELYDIDLDVPAPADYYPKCTRPEVSAVSVRVVRQKGDFVSPLKSDEVASETYGGPGYEGSYSSCASRIGFKCALQEKMVTEPGQKVRVTVSSEGATEERIFQFVSLKEYERRWQRHDNAIIDPYKVKLLGQIARRDPAWTSPEGYAESFTFVEGEKVAAFVDGRWREGTFEGRSKEHADIVSILHAAGYFRWEVAHVKPLRVALEQGLNVVPPYNQSASQGTSARCLGITSVIFGNS